ncbi:MAG: hypothetical protein LBF89_01870 [Bacteroidales bacterium]|nr:hypothetical protein [Bacteroidales bacterium]
MCNNLSPEDETPVGGGLIFKRNGDYALKEACSAFHTNFTERNTEKHSVAR